MIYDVNKIGGDVEPLAGARQAQMFGDYSPAGAVQFVERRSPVGAVGGTTASGAFFTMYEESSGSDAGDTFLQGGTVVGGNGGSATIPDYEVLSAGALPGGVSAGDILYLRVACTATIDDEVMLPGCLIDGNVAYTKLLTGASVPDPHVFTVDAEQGYIYTEIGRWNSATFLPSMPGNILASGCIGNFVLSRV